MEKYLQILKQKKDMFIEVLTSLALENTKQNMVGAFHS